MHQGTQICQEVNEMGIWTFYTRTFPNLSWYFKKSKTLERQELLENSCQLAYYFVYGTINGNGDMG